MIGHNGYSFDDVVAENLERGLLLAQRDCAARALQDPRLSQRHRVILAQLILMMNQQTGMAYPGRRYLSEVTGYSEAGVAKTISELVDWGYVISTRRAPEPGRRPLAHYAVIKPTIEELQQAVTLHIEALRSGADVTPVGNVTSPPKFTPRGNVTSEGNVTPVGNVSDATQENKQQNQCAVPDVTPVGNVTPVDPTVTSSSFLTTNSRASGERGTGREDRGSRLEPTDDLCRQCGTWAIANFQITRTQAFSEWQQFCDYWTSKAGKDARKVDWFRTWCNWLRNSKKNYRAKKVQEIAGLLEAEPAKSEYDLDFERQQREARALLLAGDG